MSMIIAAGFSRPVYDRLSAGSVMWITRGEDPAPLLSRLGGDHIATLPSCCDYAKVSARIRSSNPSRTMVRGNLFGWEKCVVTGCRVRGNLRDPQFVASAVPCAIKHYRLVGRLISQPDCAAISQQPHPA